MPSHLLVVDDDTRIRELLSRYLRENGFVVFTAKNAEEAEILLSRFLFNLLIVDVMMPGKNGIEMTAKLREYSDVPVLMLTAMSEVENRIAGLESGADDYLPKPFEPRELLLRIERILQRVSMKTTPSNNSFLVPLGNLRFDMQSLRLFQHDTVIPLTSAEARLLKLLIENQGKTMSRSALAELCGGVNERSIDVQIIRLRNKVERDPKKPFHLQTVRGEGYILYVG